MENLGLENQVLNLLQRIDNGYKPTDEEKSVLGSCPVLDLRGTKITELPDSIGQLSALEELDLRGTKITELPDSIGQLSALEALYLSDTKITELPDSIGQLGALKRLEISLAKITKLPDSIGQLSALKTLYLSCTNITELPDSIGQLGALKTLYLIGMSITELPDSIGQLGALEELDLSYAKITELPDSIGQLGALERLDLSETKITELPDSIGQLGALEGLYLRGTNITELPDSIGSLSKLQKLNLSYLKLKRIPESLTKLGLKFVDSDSFYLLNSGINLHNTVLLEQKISVFLESPHLISSLYNKCEEEACSECKVIFLGDGGWGKSFTIARLENGGKKENYKTNTTHGVKISDYKAPDRDYTIHFWDFGGQEIQHSMHRCFLTDDTCYVVTIRSRETNGTERARYWLRNIAAYAPSCPVLLYINCWENDFEMSGLDKTKLKNEFPNIRDIVLCSAMEAEAEEFNEKVAGSIVKMVDASGYCAKKVPYRWMYAANAIRKENEKYLTKQRYHDICRQKGIEEHLAPDLLTFFNNTGVCFSYHMDANRQELEDYMLLDPVWLTNAVYAVILEGRRSAQKGWINKDEMEDILCNETREDKLKLRVDEGLLYEPDELPFIIRVAAAHELCFQRDESKKEVFFPALCENDSPEEALGNFDAYSEHSEYRFKYEFLPDSVVHKLMIRFLKKDIAVNDCWLKGMVLGALGYYKVIVSIEDDKLLKLDLYSTSDRSASELFQIIRDEILSVNDDMSRSAEEYIAAGKSELSVAELVDDYRKNAAKARAKIGGANDPFDLLSRFFDIFELARLYTADGKLKTYRNRFHKCRQNEKPLRDALHEAYGGECRYCGRALDRNTMEVEHIIPKEWEERLKMTDDATKRYLCRLEKQGFDLNDLDYIENYLIACKPCNKKKSNEIRDAIMLNEYFAYALKHTPKVLELMPKYKMMRSGKSFDDAKE